MRRLNIEKITSQTIYSNGLQKIRRENLLYPFLMNVHLNGLQLNTF